MPLNFRSVYLLGWLVSFLSPSLTWASMTILTEIEIPQAKPLVELVTLDEGQTRTIEVGNQSILLTPIEQDGNIVKIEAEVFPARNNSSNSKALLVTRFNVSAEMKYEDTKGDLIFRVKVTPKKSSL